MFRRFGSVSAIAILTLTMFVHDAATRSGPASADSFFSGDYEYLIYEGRAFILEYLGPGGDVTIPSVLGGYPVTRIDSESFRSKGLTQVTIPDSVVSIANRAFQGNQLTTVDIPDSVTSIGWLSFAQNDLTSISFSANDSTLGPSAFAYNKLTHLNVPDSVTYIDSGAFSNNLLVHVHIPSSVTGIGDGAFESNLLSSVVIPSSVTDLGRYSFRDNLLSSVVIPSSVTEVGAFAFANNMLTHISLPDTTTAIGDGAFEANLLTAVTLPETTTRIGHYAFHNNQLEAITIPPNVTEIGFSAFENNALESVHIPNSVTSLGASAFASNELTSVSLSTSLTVIESAAFASNHIQSVAIPSSVRRIEASAFNSNELTSVTIPDDVIVVGDASFANNELASVTFGSSVAYIGHSALMENNLTSVWIPESTFVVGHGAFSSNNLSSIVLPPSVVFLGGGAFAENNLSSVTIPASLNYLGGSAFAGNSLSSVRMLGDEPYYTYGGAFDGSDPTVIFPVNARFTEGPIGYWNAGGSLYRAVKTGAPIDRTIGWLPKGDIDDFRQYVALGDSYQSGEGAYNYYPGTDGWYQDVEVNLLSRNICHRSKDAYPVLITKRMVFGPGVALDFWACSGAVFDDLYTDDVSALDVPYSDPRSASTYGFPIQGSAPYRAIDRLTDETMIVTFGMGGNDIGFAPTLNDCVTNVRSCTRLNEESKVAIANMRSVYRSNFSTIRSAAPNATVFVTGYPRYYAREGEKSVRPQLPDNATLQEYNQHLQNVSDYERGYPYTQEDARRTTIGCALDRSEQLWLNDMIARLNTVMREEAMRAGFIYIDIYDVGQDSEICNGVPNNQEFMNSVVGLGDAESFHPNKVGHKLIADSFSHQLQNPRYGQRSYILPNQTTSTIFYVEPSGNVVFTTTWPGSDIETFLVAPSGRVIDRDTVATDVDHTVGATAETYSITDPEVGEWTIYFYGADVELDGEPLIFQAFAEPLPNQFPVAAATLEQRGAFVSVDAVTSQDPDGEIVEYLWDFGDGQTALGQSATYFYPEPGEYEVVLRVQDDDGAYDWVSIEDVVVADYSDTGSSSSADRIIPITGAAKNSTAPSTAAPGVAVALGFDLGTDRGQHVLVGSAPGIQQVACSSGAALDGAMEAASSVDDRGPYFSSQSDQYQWNWNTESSWSGTCQKLTFYFVDGSVGSHTIRFVSTTSSYGGGYTANPGPGTSQPDSNVEPTPVPEPSSEPSAGPSAGATPQPDTGEDGEPQDSQDPSSPSESPSVWWVLASLVIVVLLAAAGLALWWVRRRP